MTAMRGLLLPAKTSGRLEVKSLHLATQPQVQRAFIFPSCLNAELRQAIIGHSTLPPTTDHRLNPFYAVCFATPVRFFSLALFATLAAVPTQARLGETLDQLKARLGKPEQQAQPRKDTAVWLFEAEDGQLIYNVTFDAQGRSIAEGLRPLKRAIFTKDIAQDFIQSQIAPFRSSPTLQTFKPGEKYQFAGQAFTCGEQELAIVDDANGVMIVWAQKGVPSVMAVSHAMVRNAR